MKSKYETLKNVVEYVKNESETPIDELLMMGFSPCQLVFEFGFDKELVKSSEVYKNLEDSDLDCEELPFSLDKFNSFDAALVFWFKLSDDQLLKFKSTKFYWKMLSEYESEKSEALTDITNNLFSRFEDEILDKILSEVYND